LIKNAPASWAFHSFLGFVPNLKSITFSNLKVKNWNIRIIMVAKGA
jgi:hypothetical protein